MTPSTPASFIKSIKLSIPIASIGFAYPIKITGVSLFSFLNSAASFIVEVIPTLFFNALSLAL